MIKMGTKLRPPAGSFILGGFCVLLSLLCPVEVTHISRDVALSICSQQKDFVETQKLGPPLKTPVHSTNFKTCAWYEKLSSCDGADNSVGTCDVSFAKKPCSAASDSSGSRIIGGTPVSPYQYPSYMRILNKRFVKRTQCGAVILNANWAITSTLCIVMQAGNFTLLAGRHNLSVPEEDEQARKFDVVLYPQNIEPPDPGSVDLLLLYWKEPLIFSDKVAPAKLPDQPYDEGTFWLVGDGETEEEGAEAGDAKVANQVQVSPMTDAACGERVLENKQPVDEWIVCYGDGESKGACNGDGGGPSYFLGDGEEQILVGIGSWVFGAPYCDSEKTVSGYTQLYYYKDWILENIKTVPETPGVSDSDSESETFAAPVRASENSSDYLAPKDFYKSYAQLLLGNVTWAAAVILDEHTVLTTAKSVNLGVISFASVLVGRYGYFEPEPETEQYLEVDKKTGIFVHPNGTDAEYSVLEPGFVNLAIIKTKTPIQFNENVQPVTLPDAPVTDDALPRLHLLTSHASKFAPPIGSFTEKFELTPITNARCREILKFDIGNHICVDHKELGDPEQYCSLLIAAPAYLIDENDPTKQTLMGTYSARYGSCRAKYPIWVYTQVYDHLDWIKENMGKPGK